MHTAHSLLLMLQQMRNATSDHMLWLVNQTSHGNTANRSDVEEKLYPVVCVMFACGAMLLALRAFTVFRRARALVALHAKLD
jgi:hypothetical protein